MQNELSSLPGYRVCEYLLVLQPGDGVLEKITSAKEVFYNKYSVPSAKWSKPHITLIKFSQLQMMEERIVNRFKMLACGMAPLKIELNNFGSFPSHTIYINIENKASIQQLVKSLKPAQPLLKTQDIKPHFINNPHITIARQIPGEQFDEIWKEYQQLHFSGKFTADDMLLLRRPQGIKSYQEVQHFAFKNQPSLSKQGSLF